jgi:Transglycosylase SLT domain
MADPMNVGDAIDAAAAKYGLNPAVLKGIAQIESSWDPSSNRNRNTQYKGLFQLGSDEWKQHGSGDVYNARDNADAAGSLLNSHSQWFQNNYGREPSPSELYMMHQQGRGFFKNGTMTNISGNPYPGMKGPQTPESFHQGWAARLERAMAPYGGGNSIAGAPATAPDIWNPANAEKTAAADMPDASALPPGMANMVATAMPPPGAAAATVAAGVGTPAIGKAPADVTADAEKRLGMAQKAVEADKETVAEKNSKVMMALAQQLMTGSQAKPVQFAQMAPADTGPFRPLPLNLPPGFGSGRAG